MTGNCADQDPGARQPGAMEWRIGCGKVAQFQIRTSGMPGARMVLADLFSPIERAHSGSRRGSEGFAGRLAAKYAVADVLGAGTGDRGLLRRIQIAPVPRHPCRNPSLCERGHPPAVGLDPGAEIGESGRLIWIDVSVSHERDHAFAAALAILRWPSGDSGPGG